MSAHTLLVVSDRGPGISSVHQYAIFQRFFRIDDRLSNSGSGVGLGLAICRHLVRKMKGRIDWEANPGGGSRFVVKLRPAVASVLREVAFPKHRTRPNMNTHRLLIVEDDPALLRGVADNFSARGYHVETAADGERGLDKARRLKLDLAILDVMLPRINGYEICRYLRQEGAPCLSSSSRQKARKAMSSSDSVSVPMTTCANPSASANSSPASKRSCGVRRRTDHKGGEPGEDECRFGDFVLDRGSRCLRRIGGDEVELSPKEYGLLNYLCQRAGRALSRDEIMDEVWGYDSRVTSRSIDRFVTNLRKKIETDPDHPHIETIREFGYRFRV